MAVEKRNAVRIGVDGPDPLGGGQLPFGVCQGAQGAAHPPPRGTLLWVPASDAALVVPGLLFSGDQSFFPGTLLENGC